MKLPDVDKMGHFGAGAFAASLTDSVALPILWLLGAPLVIAAVLGVLVAFRVGRWKEEEDAKANAEAVKEGKLPPHGVETKDWQFTAWGGVAVAIPIIVLSLL